MTDTKQAKSTFPWGRAGFDFRNCCGGFEEMFQMMQKFCRGETGTFDCSAMMKKMCGEATKKPEQQ